MGGRGSSSGGAGGGSGMDVTHGGQTTRYYFSKKNGTNYYQRGISGTPEPTPGNMSAREFRKRVEANGASVKSVSASVRAADAKSYKADRKKTNTFLDSADVQMGGNRSGQRKTTRGRRGGKRRI